MKLTLAFAFALVLAGCSGGCAAIEAASHVAKAAHACENTRVGLQEIMDFSNPETKVHRLAKAELDALHVLCGDEPPAAEEPEQE